MKKRLKKMNDPRHANCVVDVVETLPDGRFRVILDEDVPASDIKKGHELIVREDQLYDDPHENLGAQKEQATIIRITGSEKFEGDTPDAPQGFVFASQNAPENIGRGRWRHVFRYDRASK